MSGKILTAVMVIVALLVGAGIYYTQVYAYYYEVPANGETDVQLVARADGQPKPIPYSDFRGIDADSAPIRYRACFTTSLRPEAAQETYLPYDERPVPLIAPRWFDCFDANAIGTALEQGKAQAFLEERNIQYGIDRVVAITRDGHGYAWNQINHCGKVVFDGDPAPKGCPEPPEGY